MISQFFSSSPMRGVAINSVFSNKVSTGKGLLKFCFIFYLCSLILLNNVFHDVICLVNTDSIFTLNYVSVDDIYFWYLLKGKVKESVKLLH